MRGNRRLGMDVGGARIWIFVPPRLQLSPGLKFPACAGTLGRPLMVGFIFARDEAYPQAAD